MERNGIPDNNSRMQSCVAGWEYPPIVLNVFRHVFAGHWNSIQSRTHRWKHFYCSEVLGWTSATQLQTHLSVRRGKGQSLKERRELRSCSLSSLSMVLAVTGVLVKEWVVDNDESGSMTVDVMISQSSRSIVSVSRPLPSWHRAQTWFTHFCQHRPMAASLWPK